MRPTGKNNRNRVRGRRNPNGSINRNTTLDSNGPDVRLRGNALQLHEKYTALGNDAAAAGERIAAEAYYQHADHYFRLHTAAITAYEERRNPPFAGSHAARQHIKSNEARQTPDTPNVPDVANNSDAADVNQGATRVGSLV